MKNNNSVVEPKFLCLVHSETKQAKTSEFGAEEGLLQSQARRRTAQAQKAQTPLWFLGKTFYWQNLGGGLQGV